MVVQDEGVQQRRLFVKLEPKPVRPMGFGGGESKTAASIWAASAPSQRRLRELDKTDELLAISEGYFGGSETLGRRLSACLCGE